MSSGAQIEVLTRGVCVVDGQLLLSRNRKVGNVYLPGGHIDFGETGAAALVREIAEEMGCAAVAGDFIGCVEHFFEQAGEAKAEINLLYHLEVTGITPASEPPCCESWIEFFWYPLADIGQSKLEPAVLRQHLGAWLQQATGNNLATTQREVAK